MKIKCSRCGKPVSTEVPEGTLVRAWIECPECIEKQPDLTAEDANREMFGEDAGLLDEDMGDK